MNEVMTEATANTPKRPRQLGIDMQHDIAAMFDDKLWAYTAVTTRYGSALGVAVANERGYTPIPVTRYCVKDHRAAEAEADRLNESRGISRHEAINITISTMVAGRVRQ